jgi:hypothetical protein
VDTEADVQVQRVPEMGLDRVAATGRRDPVAQQRGRRPRTQGGHHGVPLQPREPRLRFGIARDRGRRDPAVVGRNQDPRPARVGDLDVLRAGTTAVGIEEREYLTYVRRA